MQRITLQSAKSLRQRSEVEQVDAIHHSTLELLQASTLQNLTMNAIAQHAQMSKQTLYKHFQSKELLIVSLIQRKASNINTTLENLINNQSLTLEEQLYQVGQELLKLLMGEKSILINRIAIAYAPTDPSLGKLLIAHGRQATLAMISTIIERKIVIDKPEMISFLIAETFINLLIGDLQITHLIDVTLQFNNKMINIRVKQAVEQLLCLIKNYHNVSLK